MLAHWLKLLPKFGAVAWLPLHGSLVEVGLEWRHLPIRRRASRQILSLGSYGLGDTFIELCEGHGEHARQLGSAGCL